MADNVRKVPEGYRTVTPFLVVPDAAKALEFYANAMGAREVARTQLPDGKIPHAEFMIGDSRIMLGESKAEPMPAQMPPVGMYLYVEDADALVARALEAGAEITMPLSNMFYGDRAGGIRDPFGFSWFIATHVEDVSDEEVARRAADAYARKS